MAPLEQPASPDSKDQMELLENPADQERGERQVRTVSPALTASPDDLEAKGRLDPPDHQDNQDRGVPPGKLACRGRRDNQGAQETMDNLGCLVVTDSREL